MKHFFALIVAMMLFTCSLQANGVDSTLTIPPSEWAEIRAACDTGGNSILMHYYDVLVDEFANRSRDDEGETAMYDGVRVSSYDMINLAARSLCGALDLNREITYDPDGWLEEARNLLLDTGTTGHLIILGGLGNLNPDDISAMLFRLSDPNGDGACKRARGAGSPRTTQPTGCASTAALRRMI